MRRLKQEYKQLSNRTYKCDNLISMPAKSFRTLCLLLHLLENPHKTWSNSCNKPDHAYTANSTRQGYMATESCYNSFVCYPVFIIGGSGNLFVGIVYFENACKVETLTSHTLVIQMVCRNFYYVISHVISEKRDQHKKNL